MKEVHEDVQKHAKRPHKTRSKARAPPVDPPESTVEEPHSAGIVLAPEHEISPRATPPDARSSYLLAMAFGCSTSCNSDEAWEVKCTAAPQSQDNLVNRRVAMTRGIGACFELGMGVSRSQDWRSMHLGPRTSSLRGSATRFRHAA